VMAIDVSNEIQNGLSVYSNPVRGNTITVGFGAMAAGTYELRIFNSSGQLLQSEKIVSRGSEMTQVVTLKPGAKAGLHNMLLTGEGVRQCRLFIVQ